MDEIKPEEWKQLHEINPEKLEKLDKECGDDSEYEEFLDGVVLNPELKELLSRLVGKVMMVGKKVIKVGKIVFDIAIKMIRKYPNTARGLIIGLVLGIVIHCVPLVGPFLSGLVTPVLLVLGGLQGIIRDLSSSDAPSVGEVVGFFG